MNKLMVLLSKWLEFLMYKYLILPKRGNDILQCYKEKIYLFVEEFQVHAF